MNGAAVQIVYGDDGNRVAKSVTANGVTTTTTYLVDDLNPTGYPQVVEEFTNGAPSRTYTYGLERISQYQISTGTASFYVYDGGGNVRNLTNSAGTVTDSYEYDAYGNEFTVSGGSNTPNEMLYRGEQFDSDLGLYYLRARYYNPLTGRFMGRDPNEPKVRDSTGTPIDPKKLHKYLYAGGDPVNMIDPSGRNDEEEEGFLYTEIGPTSEEIKKFIVGPVFCAAGVDVYAISVLNGGNAMDNSLGGATTAAGCAALLLGW